MPKCSLTCEAKEGTQREDGTAVLVELGHNQINESNIGRERFITFTELRTLGFEACNMSTSPVAPTRKNWWHIERCVAALAGNLA